MRPDVATRRSAIMAAISRTVIFGLSAKALAAPSPAPDSGDGQGGLVPGIVDLLDVIPVGLRRAVADGSSRPDIARYVQAALALLERQGGILRVPGGTYRLGKTVNIPRRVRIVGTGRASSIFEVAHNGHGFSSNAPINAFTPVNIGIAHLGIICLDNQTSKGAGFNDRGGTYVDLKDVWISGFEYGCVLDQSELVGIDNCQIEYARKAAIWLVNGPDRHPGTKTTFTNRVSVSKCQLNQSDGYGIVDDGGRSHSFRDNNFNGCRLGHLRLSGYGEYVIDGNYFEESGGTPILISNQTENGRNVQRPNSIVITGNLIIAKPGRSSIVFQGATAALMTGNTFVGDGAPSVCGLNSIETLVSDANAIHNPAGPFDDTRALLRQRSGELTIDRFQRLRLGAVAAGASSTLRIPLSDAQSGDMPLLSFEPPLPLRIFMPVAVEGNILVEVQNAGSAPSAPLDVLVRIRLLKA